MTDMMAIISKQVFERDFARAAEGQTLPLEAYFSKSAALRPLEDDGRLFLVTVRPPNEALWLVAVLEGLRFDGERWAGRRNSTPIRDLTALRSRLKFESGAGLSAKPGALGMALQTPRRLTEEDVALLQGKKPTVESAPTAPAAPSALARKALRASPPVPEAPPVSSPTQLDRVDTLLTQHRLLDALDALLAAWRASPSADLAHLIELLGRHVDRGLPALEGEGAALQANWLLRAGARKSSDVGWLVARLDDGTVANISKRYEMLSSFEPDPRISAPVLRIPPTYTSYGAGPLYTAAFSLVERMKDGRALELLDTQLASEDVYNRGEEHFVKLRRKVERLRAKLVPPPVPGDAELAAMAALKKKVEGLLAGPPPVIEQRGTASEAEGEAMLAKVLAHPDDDEARGVYADFLLERGDTRGEFITLQLKASRGPLTKAEQAREAELARAHGPLWIRPLDTLVVADSLEFVRGFLDRCAANVPKQVPEELLLHPLWGTVRMLDCEDQRLLNSPALKALEYATFDPEGLSQLALATRPVPLKGALGRRYGRTRVGLQLTPRNEHLWSHAVNVGALTQLKAMSMVLWSLVNAPWFLESRLAMQLEVLEVTSGFGPRCDDLFDRVAPLDKLRRLIVRQSNNSPNYAGFGKVGVFCFDRTRAGAPWNGVLQLNAFDDATLEQGVVHSLEGFPRAGVQALRVESISAKKATPSESLLALLRSRFAEVTVSDVRARPIELYDPL